MLYEYNSQEEQEILTAYSDASNASDRRSTPVAGRHFTKSWSKTQSLIALSSAESELYALVRASAQAMEFQSVTRYLRQSWRTVGYSDASPALCVIQRQGLDRLRHVDCSFVS